MTFFGRKKKGTVETLLEKKQKAELKEWKKEEARREKLAKIRAGTEVAEAEAKKYKAEAKRARAKRVAKRRTVLGLPMRKVRQTRVLSRKSRIRMI